MVIIGILAAIMVPSLLHYIDRSKADNCEVNRKALVLKLEGARAQEPGKTMYEIINENEISGEITCPSGGEYEAIDNNTVRCTFPEHGKNGVFTDESDFSMGNIEAIVPEVPSIAPSAPPATTPAEDVQNPETDDTKETNTAGELCFRVGEQWFSSLVADHFAKENVGTSYLPFPNNKVITVDGSKFYMQYEGSGEISYYYNDHYNIHINDMAQINTDNILEIERIKDDLNNKFTQDITCGQIIVDKYGQYYVAVQTIDHTDFNNGQDVSKETYWRPMTLCSQ